MASVTTAHATPPRRLTIAEETAIGVAYTAGARVADLADTWGVKEHRVYRILRRVGVERRRVGHPSALSEAQQVDAVTRYRAGQTTTSIGEALGVRPGAVRNALRSRGVKMRNLGTRFPVNHNALDDLTDAALYWAGFLFADGCITPPRAGRVQQSLGVGLALRDIGHIEKLQAFIGSRHKISVCDRRGTTINGKRINSGPLCHLRVPSDGLVNRLHSLGMRNPGRDSTPSPVLAESPDFWRGVIDGDGTVMISTGRPSITLYGWKPLIDAYQQFVATRHISPARPRPRPESPIFAMTVGGRPAVELTRTLYGDAQVALDRKMSVARNIMDQAGQLRLAI